MSRPNLHFVITRSDYWDYYKITRKKVKLEYDQFDISYKNWHREYRTGNSTNLNLYINIPYVYDSLIEIFEKIGDAHLSSLCQKNVETLRNARLKEVQLEPSSGKMDRNWYSNLLTLIKNDLEESMKAQDYTTAKERFFQAFELLER